MSETMLLTIGAGLIIIGAVLMALTALALRDDRLTPDSALAGIGGLALALGGVWLVRVAVSP